MSSIFTQLFTFSKAVTSQVIAGCPATSDEEIKNRSEVCSICPSLNKEEYRCNECGCYLKFKIPLLTSECPLKKWANLEKEEGEDESKNMY